MDKETIFRIKNDIIAANHDSLYMKIYGHPPPDIPNKISCGILTCCYTYDDEYILWTHDYYSFMRYYMTNYGRVVLQYDTQRVYRKASYRLNLIQINHMKTLKFKAKLKFLDEYQKWAEGLFETNYMFIKDLNAAITLQKNIMFLKGKKIKVD